MKKIFFSVVLVVLSAALFAQEKEEEEEKGFKKENLFTGGSVTLSFFNGSTIIGANPIFGYKLANFVDAGVVVNFISTSQRDYLEFDDKVKPYMGVESLQDFIQLISCFFKVSLNIILLNSNTLLHLQVQAIFPIKKRLMSILF